MITEKCGSKSKVHYEELKDLLQQSDKFTFFEFKNRRITFKQFRARVVEQVQNKIG